VRKGSTKKALHFAGLFLFMPSPYLWSQFATSS